VGYSLNKSMDRNLRLHEKFKTTIKPKKIKQVNLLAADSDEGQELPSIFDDE
jgi:hypothetical protein